MVTKKDIVMSKALSKFTSLFNLKYFFIALIHFFITAFASRTVFNKTPFNMQMFIISEIIILFILILFWQTVPHIIKKIRERDQKTITFLKYFSIYFSIMLVFLLLTWPGVWRFDEFYIFYTVRNLAFASWQHWLTSAFYMFSLFLFPFPVSVVFFQLLFISLIVAYIITQFHFQFQSKYTYLLLVPFLFPSYIDNNLFPFKLPLYSYIELLLFCSIIFKYLSKSEINYKNIFCWSILTAIVASWRTESVFLIIAIPILLVILFYKQLKIKQVISLILITSLCSGWIMHIQNKEIGAEKSKYMLTGIIAPLSAILKTDFKTNDKTRDLQVISNVIDIDSMLRSDWMLAFFEKGMIKNTDKKSIDELFKVYIKLVIYNLPEFLKERTLTFYNSTFNTMSGNINGFNSVAYIPTEFTNKPINSNLRLITIELLECRKHSNNDQPTLLFNFFYNPIISFFLFIIFAAIGIYKRSKLLFFIPSLLLIQTIFTILTSPSYLFMYYLPIYICGYVFLAILLLSNFKQKMNT